MSYGCRCHCENFLEHARGVNISPSATPSRNRGFEVASQNKRENVLVKDMKAYKSLRRQGLQPKGIDGSAEIATRADHQVEVETGKILQNPIKSSQGEEVLNIQRDVKAAGI